FAPASVLVNANAVLTFTLTNPNPAVALSAVSFSDTYPPNLVNANPAVPAVSNTCGGSLTASPGGTSVSLTGGSIAAAGSCTISVPVASAIAGTYTTTSGNIADTAAGSGNTANATLDVTAPQPSSSVLKQIGTSPAGPWLDFVAVAPGTPLYYRFTIENTGDVALDPFAVSDPTLAAAGIDPASCAWQTSNVPSALPSLPVASATIDPTATCVVGPVSATLGAHENTATAQGTFGGGTFPSTPSTADYIGAVPGFSLVKQIATSPLGPWSSAIGVAAGTDVFYRFTLVNTGGLDLSGIDVTDAMVDLSSCTFTDPLVVGDATTCTVGPVVAAGSTGTLLVNTATGHGTNGGTVDTQPSSASYTISSANADLAITNTDGVTSVTAGTATTYTVTVSNNGPDDVTNATVVDAAPAGVTFGAWSCAVTNPGSGGSVVTGCGFASGSGNVNTTATLQAGASVTYTIAADVAGSASGSLTTTATVAAPSGVFDAVSSNDSASDTDTVTILPPPVTNDLAVTIDDGVASLAAGAGTTYTITVTNNGVATITGGVLTDAVVPGLVKTAVACAAVPGQCAAPPTIADLDDGAFALPALAPGATYAIAVTAEVTATSGVIANTATIAMPSGITDDVPADNSATDIDAIVPPSPSVADVSVSVDDGVTGVTQGAPVTYTIVVQNSGPQDVVGVSVTDTFPLVLTGVSWTCAGIAGGLCPEQPGNGDIGATVNLPVGSIVVFTASATLSPVATGALANTATATVPPTVTDSNLANNSATDVDTITLATVQADLAMNVTANSGTASPGGSITYTLTIVNNGPSGVADAAVTDVAPPGIVFGNWTCSVANAGSGGGVTTGCGAPSGSGNVNATVTLQPGATVAYAIAATVSAGASGSIVDAARVDVPSGTTDSAPLNNASTATISVQAPPPPPTQIAQPIPTLSEWALVALSLLMLAAAALSMRRSARR
ncbi:MAG TPA: DUF11 domain-containing protein, partial [Casimicrobiaceae bacterium]